MIRPGLGLVELIVALAILAVALLGLAGTAVVAHRSFVAAEALEEGTSAAAAVLDSLMRSPALVDGARQDGRISLRWSIQPDSGGVSDILLRVDIADGNRGQALSFNAYREAP